MNDSPSFQNEVDITFFVPCYNEENNVVVTIETILDALKETTFTYEIFIFDDHSSDRTVEVVEEYCKANPQVPIRLQKNSINRGLGYNYVECAFHGRGKYFMAIFGDNAEPKETILAIVQQLGKADIVIPYFGSNDSRTFLRRAISRTFVGLVNLLSGFHLKYYNGPVIHLRYNVMRWHSNTLGFAYQAELITQLLGYGATYVEVEVSNRDRDLGLTKAFTFKNILSVNHSLFQILCKRIRRVCFKV